MSVGRGIQSVIFYYLSCAPCTKVANRRNRKRQSEKDKAQREAVALQNPDTYRQPSPFRTNQYWAEEIRAGPGPPLRRLPKKERKRRQLEKDERGRSPTRRQSQGEGKKDILALPEPAYLGGIKTIIRNNQNRLSGLESKWKDWRGFQREDEELWGNESTDDLNDMEPDSRRGPVRHGSSIGVPGPLQLDSQGRLCERREGYWMARHPPVNDLHPPVVSVPNRSKPANQWMLQPPPPSAVMNGYRHSSRYRSDSENGTRKDRGKMATFVGREITQAPAEFNNTTKQIEKFSTQVQSVPPSSSPLLDGVADDSRGPQHHGDSGIDVSGSSDQSTTSQDQTIRHDFAYAAESAIITQPVATSKIITKRRAQTSSTSHASVVSQSSRGAKKASRVAMPIRAPNQSSDHRGHKSSTSRPHLSRVLSNPDSTVSNYVSLDRAQLGGRAATGKTNYLSHHLPIEDDRDDEADIEDEEDLVDPLDPRPPRRRRGQTESQAETGKRAKGLLFPNLWMPGHDNVIEPQHEEGDEDVATNAEDEYAAAKSQQNYFTLPAGSGMSGGRRWSFDL